MLVEVVEDEEEVGASEDDTSEGCCVNEAAEAVSLGFSVTLADSSGVVVTTDDDVEVEEGESPA